MQDETDQSPPRAPRPRDAATLILARREGDKTLLLMGKRSAKHSFMPNKFVFPGGRVDAADARLKTPIALPAPVLRRAAHGTSEARATALALAAIRETFEETGLRIARPAPAPLASRSSVWGRFGAAGCVPALDALDFVFRAITPPRRHKRFDTRFFMADAGAIHGEVETTGSGELLELHWVPLQEAQNLDLPNITRIVLKEIERRQSERCEAGSQAPFTRFVRGKPLMDWI